MAEQKTIFITGTDTDTGKTICCSALLQAAAAQKLSTLAYKPVAAGCSLTAQGLRNMDALTLQENCTMQISYQDVNPVAFQQAIAPHIAAELQNNPIDIDLITQGLENLQRRAAELIIVEGAGGWRLPLNNTEMLSDWVVARRLPVILVVGMKLGCLNHALLTYETVINDGLQVIGWIANQLQPDMEFYQENRCWLQQKIAAPMIAEIPYLENTGRADLAQFVKCDLAELIAE